jgi:hypothetical protein
LNTAQVSIEYVLTGLLALCAFVLPFVPKLPSNWDQSLSTSLVGVLGVAYLLGVVFDRAADSILSPLEQYIRLRLASNKILDHRPWLGNDPFPQDALEFRLRHEKDGRLEWMEALRGRIRTIRALVVLGPPAAIGMTIYEFRPALSFDWPRLAAACNLFLVAAVAVITSLLGLKSYRTNRFFVRVSTPETKERLLKPEICSKLKSARCSLWRGPFVYYYLSLIVADVTVCQIWAWQVRWHDPFDVLFYRNDVLSHGYGVLFHGNAVWGWAWQYGLPDLLVVLSCGVVPLLLALRMWYLITGTYLEFVYQELPVLLKERAD